MYVFGDVVLNIAYMEHSNIPTDAILSTALYHGV